MTIYVLSGFNNYYNRVVKKFDTISEYEPYVLHVQQNYNFVPNDNVNTQVVLGNIGNQYTGEGDYLIVVNESNEIVSRWFIIESVRDRAGQYTLTLHRDLVVDHYDEVLDAPMFIEKATITDINDPAIFNRESLTFNQIKQSEYFLKDETNCPWIVGYIPKSLPIEQKTVVTKYNSQSSNVIEVDRLSDWEDYDYYTGVKVISGPIQDIYFGYNARITEEYTVKRASDDADVKLSVPRNASFYFKNGSIISVNNLPVTGSDYTYRAIQAQNEYIGSDAAVQAVPGYTYYHKMIGGYYHSKYTQTITDSDTYQLGFTNYTNTTFKQIVGDYLDTDNDGDFLQDKLNTFTSKYKDTILLDKSTGFQYKIAVVRSASIQKKNTWLTAETTPFQYLNSRQVKTKSSSSLGIAVDPKIEGTANNNTYFVSANYYEYTLELTPVYEYAGVTLDTSIYELNDQPYYMFCMPYTSDVTVVDGSQIKYRLSSALSIAMATSFAAEIGKENIFDIQLLPYCPARYAVNAFQPTPGWVWTDEANNIGHGGIVNNIDYTAVTTRYIFDESEFSGLFNPIKLYTQTGDADPVATNTEVGKIFWAPSGNFSFDIQYSIPTKQNALELKVATETEVYRLCSPNYSGVFEFDPYMNGGIYNFNVDCSYKPFNPYIHINPTFSYLYGDDFNDQRGLIIQGDFSLPQETNAWTQYELNNKNYQQIFDRGIQNLKVNQDVQRKQQVFSAVTGTLMGGAAGAVMGAKGGIGGAIAGAVLGTGASAFGGLLDVSYGDMLRAEALDYTKDMYAYNLGNIQALPNGITKSSPLTANFKYFPFIEKYDCTEIEKIALRDKIKYNGMTIMRIGNMQQFISNDFSYIKGKLIRLETIEDDYHIINALSGELDKGVFIK